MDPVTAQPLNNQNISHFSKTSFEEAFNQTAEKIRARGDLPLFSVKEQINLLEQLAEFPVGRFLIQNKGLNGEWTDYALMHPTQGRVTGFNSEGKPFSELESFLLNKAPVALATQERFEIFKEELQKHLENGMRIASVPCGVMSDLLTLDYNGVEGVQLFGVDLDEHSLDTTRERIIGTDFLNCTTLIQEDAWTFTLPEPVDLLTSNGLNIYEKEDSRVVELYRQFFHNLKPGGTLITSFLTPPPTLNPNSAWNLSEIDLKAAGLEKTLFADIIGSKWQAFRTFEQTKLQLEEAGFEAIELKKDRAGIFPTVLAKKPLI